MPQEISRREMIGAGGIAVLLVERLTEWLNDLKAANEHQRLLDAWQKLLEVQRQDCG